MLSVVYHHPFSASYPAPCTLLWRRFCRGAFSGGSFASKKSIAAMNTTRLAEGERLSYEQVLAIVLESKKVMTL